MFVLRVTTGIVEDQGGKKRPCPDRVPSTLFFVGRYMQTRLDTTPVNFVYLATIDLANQ